MGSNLTGTAALVTGASSGIGAATARQLADHGAAVALVARRRDRLEALAAEIDQAGGTGLVVEADITDRTQAEAAVQQTVERFGRLDTLVNNAGLMLLGPVVGADTQDWDRMSPSTSRACSPPPAPPSRTCCGPPNRARAGSPTSSTSARSPAVSPGAATACTASPSSA
jgi:NADP-dependent 3-hydroxy acid dehydrogenase YdfG